MSINRIPHESPGKTPLAKSWGPPLLLSQLEQPTTQADHVTRLLFDDIVQENLRPGERLKPEDLSARYSFGLSPIREALCRLGAEGLLRGGGYRGFEVPEVDTAELLDMANVRAELSSLALRDAIRRGDDAWEVSIIAAYHSLERIPDAVRLDQNTFAEAWERRNRGFHLALESACASPWLKHFISVTAVHTMRYRRRFFDYEHDSRIAQREHKHIMDAVLERDAEKACLLLSEHIVKHAQRSAKRATQRDDS